MDAVEYRKISWPCWESNPSHPVSILSLYWLSQLSSAFYKKLLKP
jgi:hypothetical protein